jgi:hypothetical protein
MSTSPRQDLETRAAEERKRLHTTIIELKSQVRETLDVKRAAREYVKPASAVCGVVALLAGYAFAGIFTRH